MTNLPAPPTQSSLAEVLESEHLCPGTNKVVLFYPPYDGPPLGAPLSLLCLASPLLQAGFEVKLVDNLLYPNYERAILRETEDALCLGISVLTGPHIGAAVRVSRAVKKL